MTGENLSERMKQIEKNGVKHAWHTTYRFTLNVSAAQPRAAWGASAAALHLDRLRDLVVVAGLSLASDAGETR